MSRREEYAPQWHLSCKFNILKRDLLEYSHVESIRLLAYYTVLTSLCPQILSNEYTQPAIEVRIITLLEELQLIYLLKLDIA